MTGARRRAGAEGGTDGFLGLAAALALVIVGCGGGSSSAAIDPWLGNWMEGGTQSTTCGASSTTTQLSGLAVISAGPKENTIQTLANSCALIWDVSGDKATLESGQVCTVAIEDVNVTVAWTASSLTLSGDTMTGLAGGATNNGCSFTQQATFAKM